MNPRLLKASPLLGLVFAKVVFMDKELLARKLYVERVMSLMGDHTIDDDILEFMWECKASPEEAAKAMLPQVQLTSLEVGAKWVNRYLNRK